MPGYRRAYKTAKRLYPLMLAAYRRWDNLTEAEKEQYKERARRISNQALGYARQATGNAGKGKGKGKGKSSRPRPRPRKRGSS
jgi:hypothetical protein